MTTTIDAPAEHSTSGPSASAEQQTARTEALVGRLFESTVSALELVAIHLGDRLGLYAALHGSEPLTSAELAHRAGIAERYAREWLEQQAVCDILTVDDAGANALERRYSLPDHVIPALLEPTSPFYIAAVAGIVPLVGQIFDQLVEVYRSGDGLPWSAYPPSVVELQAAFNRPAFTHELDGWLAAVPDIDERLSVGKARVADLACGAGWSTQAIARRYPDAVVDGYDIDDASIALARRNLAESGLANRVRFEVSDLAQPAETSYDVATMFEALHDMSHPVQVLTSIRRSLLPGGVLLVADERAAEEFTAPGDLAERLFYGSSLVVCLPNSLSDNGVGTGAAMRPATVRGYAAAAGFASCEVVDIEHPIFRFYLMRTDG